MFQTWDNSQLLRRVLWISAELTIVSSLKHKNTQPLYIFNRVRVLHLDRLKEGTWLHSFVFCSTNILLKVSWPQNDFLESSIFQKNNAKIWWISAERRKLFSFSFLFFWKSVSKFFFFIRKFFFFIGNSFFLLGNFFFFY